MIKQNFVIINFNSLYEILDEIKENLFFNIIKYENEEAFIKTNNIDLKNLLLFSNSYKKLLLNKKIVEKNILNLNEFPMSLIKLVELINIQFIKLRFNQQSKINIRGYELNLNSKFFSKGNSNLRLTEKEIEIILYLDEAQTQKSVIDLQKNIWGYSSDLETHTVETHIYRLRKKISTIFGDECFILSYQNGYFIQ